MDDRNRIVVIILSLLASIVTSQNLHYLPVDGQSSECAVIVQGTGRSTLYGRAINLFTGTQNLLSGQQEVCITFDSVNEAYLQASRVRDVQIPTDGKWDKDSIASVGELLLEVSRILANTYSLSSTEIDIVLPLIDTSRTMLAGVCPSFLSQISCEDGKYRRADGLCNNLENPTWGASRMPFQRMLNPWFPDGMHSPRISVQGSDLPSPRAVSHHIHRDLGHHDHAITLMMVAWGQFVDHDITNTAVPTDPITKSEPETCCRQRPGQVKHAYCMEIRVPEDDDFYNLFKVKCLDFVRSFSGVRQGCRLGSKAPFNLLTSVIDANTIYGVTVEKANQLRMLQGGLLRMNPIFADIGLKPLLPIKTQDPDEQCIRPNSRTFCFESGEVRVNELLVLTGMHVLFGREHNRVATNLALVNPHWDDETLFQEARRIVIAELQHITYKEFLPILLGKNIMNRYGLTLQDQGYYNGYDPTANSAMFDAFVGAAFRFGHSLLPNHVERWSKSQQFIASRKLSDMIRQPFDLYRPGALDEYLVGMSNQVAQAMDDLVTTEVTNQLFKKPGSRFGFDLVAFNIQRGREFGLAPFMEYRKVCGLPVADDWTLMKDVMNNETLFLMSQVYTRPQDIDLFSGGIAELPVEGSMMGPTFSCIIASQFQKVKQGDRFWYENGGQPSSFTPGQLQEIRKSSLSRVMCDNSDIIDTLQLYPMVLPDYDLNPRVACRSSVLPRIDFSHWRDPTAPLLVSSSLPHVVVPHTVVGGSLVTSPSVLTSPSHVLTQSHVISRQQFGNRRES